MVCVFKFEQFQKDGQEKSWSGSDVEEKINKIEDLTDENAWTPEMYIEWFLKEFDFG